MYRVVHIPIEKKHRELMSKLLVALELVSRGVPVVMGYSRALFANARNWPRGVMYLKGMNRVQHEVICQLPKVGHLAVACDEEAMGAHGLLLVKDCWHETRPLMTKVLCQGPEHRDVLLHRRGFSPDQLAITGNPRLDLLRPPFVDAWRDQADAIAAEHGDFILVNTDMSATNSRHHDLDYYREVLVQIGWLDPDSPDDLELLDQHISHDQANMDAVRDFVLAVRDALPGHKVVLRPHPSEDETRWRELEKASGTLSVVTDSEPVPWLLAARCLVQTGCTTGVEATVLGTPSISLITDAHRNPFSKYRLANSVSQVTSAIPDAVEAARKVLNSRRKAPSQRENRRGLEPFIDIDEQSYAFEKTARELENLLPGRSKDIALPLRTISGAVDRFLAKTNDPAARQDGFFDLQEITERVDRLLEAIPRRTWVRPQIRDLEWGTYALLPPATIG